ncbi:MAG: hypothetical protein MUC64_13670 [Rubritepida sp.]|jgi:hypothetical protein|nr:hypothetical protein [Rubritepida sp.]
MTTHAPAASRRARLAHEIRVYALLSGYMFLCFLAVAAFKAALLAEEGVAFAPVAFAAIKALVLAKFLMLGEAMPLGARDHGGTLLSAALHRSLRLLALLAALLVAEELLRAMIEGRAGWAALQADVARRHWEMLASLALLWLVLLPYVGLQQIAGRLGEEAWRRVLRGGA